MTSMPKTSAVDGYIQSTFQLVRSLVIKSEISINRSNADIISKYGLQAVDVDYPTQWKYYMNIAGQYHFTDQIMKVISLDTQEEIDFTVENLRIHNATAAAYIYGSRFYFSLVAKYPTQEQLILSIVNPCDIHEAIAAADGSILTYYKNLVEPQEDTLIYDLENYIKGYLSRYTVVGFNNVWRNYPVLNLANLYGSLAGKILNLRLLACRTEKTHSFHIEQYLASHGRLDRFMPFMTLKQKLYLYHNIDYIEKFAGHTQTFEELVQWILSDRRIPLSSYTVRQLQLLDDNLYPTLQAERKPIGTLENTVESEYVPLPTFIDKEKSVHRGSASYYDYNEDRIRHLLATSPSSVIQTKDLESAMVDYTDAVPDTLPEVLLRQWVYMSSKGFYDVLVNFNHPITGERVSLLASDALIYYSYIMMSVLDHKPTEVPTFLNVKYRLHPRPSVQLLYKDLLPGMFPDLKDIADELISPQPLIGKCFSVKAFFDMTYGIYKESQRHWFLKASVHDPLKHGIVSKMVSRLYGIEDLVLYDGDMSMSAWLRDKALPEFTGTREDGLGLCKIIFEHATGYSVDENKSLVSIQRAMVDMLQQLSSYSIQIMREINASAIIPVNWPCIRVGFRGQYGEDYEHIVAPVRVLETTQHYRDDVEVNSYDDHVLADVVVKPQDTSIVSAVEVTTCRTGASSYNITENVNIPVVRIYDDSPGAGNQNDPFQPMTYYNALSQAQLKDIANIINTRK